jgi:hypothetical protein
VSTDPLAAQTPEGALFGANVKRGTTNREVFGDQWGKTSEG